MTKIDQVITTITKQGILPLYFNQDETVSIEILRALYRAGIKAIEYTHRGNEATANFKKLIAVRDAEMFDLLIGIGTIKDELQTETYLELKADFFISPGLVPEVADLLKSKEILYIPGCMTPTEIIAAENKGIQFIKLFPGNKIEPDFLASIKDIFPNLIFMPTGGVDTTKESIQAWFNAGVSAVGMGSKLISKKLMEARDYQTIENKTKDVLRIIENIK
ncbi:bifunctional 4-hydroxy-2-oxoglutarate aldolase/2-dehydro-3-deoxy-phosphogluconate aldolase [Flavobacterium sp. HJJ]|uniref:bifunctional 4-hydroxy-2-oxoglutarate aldolase/2-dehydro-3-deoxy-phosphogluconate aldolase n=1 Tax=Flavobacterium sp. HJJ TaxID=2783792 RepID=UPI00188CC36E|nr:bifunctional 4-hydroxy-2-oxoglutarate aldolase/2-dehydro-3-deoxy-phosphogluconate aldolase [Flavobacterium sp. HJJ]MBF4471506.1 bifunctional 4-hydroxy-2-oxoglutarate aldolase/2-dehydro-3-deoxy-phosphogluconate aldolase [Flavobacterium sp. HJJ]